jgi:iron complex transport system substrate-binding protein
MTSAQAGFMDALHSTNRIRYISNASYFYNEYFQSKHVIHLGDFQNLNIEKLIIEKPDLVLFYSTSYAQMNAVIQLLNNERIPYLICNEYQESSPLAQAEWIRFFGAMLNKQKEANSLFDTIQSHYTYYKKLKEPGLNKIKVMTGLPWKGHWYISGGQSILSHFIEDAGGVYFYPFASNENQALSIEKIYEYGLNSDIWIDCGQAHSLHDIETAVPFASKLQSYKNSLVYNNNKRISKQGSIDIWESGIVRPDIILKDLYFIFNHSNDPKINDSLYYYRKMN